MSLLQKSRIKEQKSRKKKCAEKDERDNVHMQRHYEKRLSEYVKRLWGGYD